MNRPDYPSHATHIQKASCSGLTTFCHVRLGFLFLLFSMVSFLVANGQSNYATPYSFTTLAGSGIQGVLDGTGSGAKFWGPLGVAVDASSNVYVADTSNNKIRKITPAGAVTTFAGSGELSSLNGTGSAASFARPSDVAVGTLSPNRQGVCRDSGSICDDVGRWPAPIFSPAP